MSVILQQLKEALVSLGPVIALTLLMHLLTGFMTAELFIRWVVGGIFALFGLFFFLRGVEYCLIPLGEMIGTRLPFCPNITVLLLLAFLVSAAANAADPSVAVLSTHIRDVSTASGPPPGLVLGAVVFGIGFFLCLGLVRILLGISSAVVLAVGYGVILLLGCFVPPEFVALAFDSGGVATGPLTVPFLLSLGIGFVSVLGKKDPVADSFGLLGLVALGPMVGVMLLGILWS